MSAAPGRPKPAHTAAAGEGSTGSAAPGRPERIPALDVARFLAASAVVAFHYGFHGGVTGQYLDVYIPALGAATQYGYLGVSVFFVVSGFVIAWSAQGSSAARFAWNRWLRVYPTFIFAVLLTSAVCWLAGDPRFGVTWPQLLAHALVDARRLHQPFIDGVYWTIVCELQFYAAVAVGLAVPWLRRRATACFALWLALSALNEFAWHSKPLAHLLVTGFSGLFIAGVMAWRVYAWRATVADIALLISALGVALACELQQAEARFAESHSAWSPWVLAALWTASLAMLLGALRWRASPRVEAGLRQLGQLTYPLYLLHATIGYLAINALAPLLGTVPAIAVATLGVLLLAAVTAFAIEPRLKAACVRAVRRPSAIHASIPARAPP